jgi:hypothetical protein
VRVAFDSTLAPQPAAVAADGADRERSRGDDATSADDSLLTLIEGKGRRRPAPPPPLPLMDGWVSVPAPLVQQQLPPGAQVRAEEILIPLALIMPRLREGEARIPLDELDDIAVPIGATESAATIEVPLRVIVPQLPAEALELPETQPPAWLSIDAALEEIYFARV